MTEHEIEVTRVLAEQVMGWHWAHFIEWDPLTDWQAAGEVLEAMFQQPIPVWRAFCVAFRKRIMSVDALDCEDTVRSFAKGNGPETIAEAAYEAVKGAEHA